jgi:hypothetical protein
MGKWIAERPFDCVDVKGKRFRAIARIGTPTTVPRDGKLSAHGRCPVMLQPLFPERAAGGIDQFQALCLAIELVRNALKTFVAQGGRVFFAGTDTPIKLDDPSFLPHLDLEWLRGRKKRTVRRKTATR